MTPAPTPTAVLSARARGWIALDLLRQASQELRARRTREAEHWHAVCQRYCRMLSLKAHTYTPQQPANGFQRGKRHET